MLNTMDKILFVHFVISWSKVGLGIHVPLKWHNRNNIHLLSVTLRLFVGFTRIRFFCIFGGVVTSHSRSFHSLPVKGYKFWPIISTMAIALMWHGASVYNGHLREPVTLPTIADPRERLAVELSPPVFMT